MKNYKKRLALELNLFEYFIAERINETDYFF